MSDNDNISLVEKGSNLRFLVVEDDAAYSRYLEAMIGRCNPKNGGVDIVDNATDAVEALRNENYDICFLDFFLKNSTTGMDVLHAVHGATMQTAFVFITVHDSKEAAYQALTLGAMDYLVKARFDEFDMAKSISFSLFRKYREIALQAEALKDSLTGLGNKALFDEQLKQSLQRASREGNRLGVLMIDLDQFKPVNDQYGHQVGDELLRQVATRIVGETRSSDILARIGGDEFAAVLVKVNSPSDVTKIRDKMAHSIGYSAYKIDDMTIQVGASVGAAVFPDDGTNVSDLLRAADMRMYDAKQQKRIPTPPGPEKEDTRVAKKLVFENQSSEINIRW